jgi:carbamate kinase
VTPGRVVIALGGQRDDRPGRLGHARAQRDAIAAACRHVAAVVATGAQVVLTHGNGPQVGNLLVKNELAAAEVPARCRWTGASPRPRRRSASRWPTSSTPPWPPAGCRSAPPPW